MQRNCRPRRPGTHPQYQSAGPYPPAALCPWPPRPRSPTYADVRVFPDAAAAGRGEDPHWLYTVVFDARELWGDAADPAVRVSIDAWEPYLEAA